MLEPIKSIRQLSHRSRISNVDGMGTLHWCPCCQVVYASEKEAYNCCAVQKLHKLHQLQKQLAQALLDNGIDKPIKYYVCTRPLSEQELEDRGTRMQAYDNSELVAMLETDEGLQEIGRPKVTSDLKPEQFDQCLQEIDVTAFLQLDDLLRTAKLSILSNIAQHDASRSVVEHIGLSIGNFINSSDMLVPFRGIIGTTDMTEASFVFTVPAIDNIGVERSVHLTVWELPQGDKA